MDEKTRSSFELAGLRAGQIAQAAAQDSRLVAAAMRLNLLRKLTKLGLKRLFKKATPPTGALQVLVHIRGGIGDVCMSRVFVKHLRAALPQAEISFSYDSQAVVNMVFSDGLIDGFVSTKYLPENFDLVISGCHFLMFDYFSRPRLEQLAPHFLPALEEGLQIQACFKPFATYSPYLDGQLAEISMAHGGSRITNLGWFTGLNVGQNDPAPIALDEHTTAHVLKKLGLSGRTYLTIHDGINTHTDTSCGTPTRCWPETHWRELVKLLKANFPHLTVVQLGGEKSRPFDFVDVSLVGKTAVADLPHVLSKSRLHIDGESGMVHLANLTQTPCVVLFGPSKAAYLGYARNTNISSPVCGGCMNISKYWMTQCILGYPPEKQCLAAISPQTVFEAVQKRLQ